MSEKYVCLFMALALGVAKPGPGALQQESWQQVNGVVREETGTPVPNISLLFEHILPQAGSDMSGFQLEAKVDDQGRFQVSLPRGKYVVTAIPPLCGVKPVEYVVGAGGANDIALLRVEGDVP